MNAVRMELNFRELDLICSALSGSTRLLLERIYESIELDTFLYCESFSLMDTYAETALLMEKISELRERLQISEENE